VEKIEYNYHNKFIPAILDAFHNFATLRFGGQSFDSTEYLLKIRLVLKTAFNVWMFIIFYNQKTILVFCLVDGIVFKDPFVWKKNALCWNETKDVDFSILKSLKIHVL